MPLLPLAVGYCNGLLCKTKLIPMPLLVLAFIWFFANIGASIILCCIFRHQQVLRNGHACKLRRRTLIFIRASLFFVFNIVEIIAPILVDFSSSSMDRTLEKFSIDISWIKERGSMILVYELTPEIRFVGFGIIVLLITTSILICGLFAHMFLVLHSEHVQSIATVRAIRRSLIVLFIQLVVPMALIVAPALIGVAGFTFNCISQQVGKVVLFLTTIHSLAHNIILLSITPAYRRFLRSALTLPFRRSARIQSSEVVKPTSRSVEVTMNSLLLISLVGVVAVAADELLSVNIVIRHADRAATSGWATANSSTILFRGAGELTDAGIDNAFAQGKDFKERYVKTGFIDKRFLPKEVYVRSSSVNRCLMSAASFTNALFKRSPKDHAVVPPIYTKDLDSDGLLVPLLTCQDGWEDVVARFNLSSTVNVQQTALVAMMMTQWPAACSTVNPALIDAIVSELPNKLIDMPANYKACAEGPAKEFMYKYIELLAGAGDHYNEKRIKRVAGLLTSELLANFAAAGNPAQPKMRIYYTHDVNVLALSHIFGVLDRFNGVTPAFSSALVFETRRNDSGATYILQKNGQKADFVDTNNCASDCSLATVTSGASPLAITAQINCA